MWQLNENKKLVYVGLSADILHEGHKYFKNC